MKDKVLITGGAGFIGSRLATELVYRGHEVSILDCFSPQIHGERDYLPPDLRDSVQLFRGDVRDQDACERALNGQNVLVHLAAETGTGQSMYRIRHYTDVNLGGTANLMELLLNGRFPIKNVIVASSRAVYGEGAGCCEEHGTVFPYARCRADMEAGNFDPKCPVCGRNTGLAPTPEHAPFRPSSFYGLTKQAQEQMVLMYAASLGINGFALRYQNVYGPGQSLKNPYTGILAIFANQARANDPVYIFEDGRETRDFVYIEDVVEATLRCIGAPPCPPIALNVGTGNAITVWEVAQRIIQHFSSHSECTVTGGFREGDIRHNCASTERLKSTIGFVPTRAFAEGLKRFLDWVSMQPVESANYQGSLLELRQRGLLHD